MLQCFTLKAKKPCFLYLMTNNDFKLWLHQQSQMTQNIIQQNGFTALGGELCFLPNVGNEAARWLVGIRDSNDLFAIADLSTRLPAGSYQLENYSEKKSTLALGFALGAYRFLNYKNAAKTKPLAQLLLDTTTLKTITPYLESTYQIRDLINTPANDLGPAELANTAVALAKTYSATCKILKGEQLLKNNYPAIYQVGQASTRDPHLIDLRFGKKTKPKLTLVGKGVCFDTGGLNIKIGANMALMKKDMGGAAHVLGLAKLIMDARLPVQLRVLIPAVDNAIAGNAYRPGDIITTRAGYHIEIGDTDAEGRLILADALYEAAAENPDLIIDFATLTGAARVALGTEIPLYFTPQQGLADGLQQACEQSQELMWRLPLHAPYRSFLDSNCADMNNIGGNSYGGAIIAGLFLKEFVASTVNWIHIDMMAWNIRARAGRPVGGEAMGLRAVWQYLQNRYLPH